MTQPSQPGTAVRPLDRTLVVIGCTLLVALFVTVLLGIVTRAFNEPLTWTDEAARFLMVWLACAGWIIAGRQRAHVRISFFLDRVPHGLRRGTNLVILVALTVLGSIVAWFGMVIVLRNLDMEANSLPVSAAWLYAPIVPAGVALVLQSLVQLREEVRSRPVADCDAPQGTEAVETTAR